MTRHPHRISHCPLQLVLALPCPSACGPGQRQLQPSPPPSLGLRDREPGATKNNGTTDGRKPGAGQRQKGNRRHPERLKPATKACLCQQRCGRSPATGRSLFSHTKQRLENRSGFWRQQSPGLLCQWRRARAGRNFLQAETSGAHAPLWFTSRRDCTAAGMPAPAKPMGGFSP